MGWSLKSCETMKRGIGNISVLKGLAKEEEKGHLSGPVQM